MRLTLTLDSRPGTTIPINYQYPISAVIYRILARADAAYASFLHQQGYSQAGSLKTFKLFCFSDLNTAFRISGDRLVLTTGRATLIVCFYLPEAAEKFVSGLFADQRIQIADNKSGGDFVVTGVELAASGLTSQPVQRHILAPLSAVICGQKNERGNYDFLAPGDPAFAPLLLNNWKEKYAAALGAEAATGAFAIAELKVLFYNQPPRSRLIAIKAGSAEETKIRGFTGFQLQVTGSRQALELLLDAGAGIYNSAAGCGCVEIVSTHKIHQHGA
jgi:CRISPR-associated endoribonuclease Cas6